MNPLAANSKIMFYTPAWAHVPWYLSAVLWAAACLLWPQQATNNAYLFGMAKWFAGNVAYGLLLTAWAGVAEWWREG